MAMQARSRYGTYLDLNQRQSLALTSRLDALLVCEVASVTVRAARFLIAAANSLRVRAATVLAGLQLAASVSCEIRR
jgi:hypothetical protein